MTRRLARLIVSLAALVLTAALVVGIPVGLVVFAGWPGPSSWPTVDQLRVAIDNGVTDTTVIKLLAVVVWLSWAQVTAAIVVEAVAQARRQAARVLPLVPGLQPLAARLVAAIALVAATSGAPRAGAAISLEAVAATTPPAALFDADTPAAPVDPAAASEPSGPTRTVVTTARDSWWRLAEDHLGDGMRWRQIRELNVGRTVADGVVLTADTAQLDHGWFLLVPATDTDTPAGEPSARLQEWEVEHGDHFWGIAEQSLTDQWGREPTDAEVAPYWRQVIDANRGRLQPPHDPDLIYPEQRFVIPQAPADPTAPADDLEHTEAEEPNDRPERYGDAPPEPTPPADADDALSGPPASTAGHPDGWQTAITATPTPATTPHETADSGASAHSDDEAVTALGVPAGLAAGVAASSLLAAGVAAVLRWRRRTALATRAPGLRLPTPLPDTADKVARLEAAAMPEQRLDDLAALLTSIPDHVHPALVTTDDDGTIRLLFDDVAELPDPPSPWGLTDDGTDGPVGWTARIGDPGPERSVGLPLLVTLGRTDSTNVLANVAAIGTLAVTGALPDVRRRLSTMSLEVATSRIAVPVEVAVCGDHLLASLDQVRHIDDPEAEVVAALSEVAQDVVIEDRTPRLLVCHGERAPAQVPDELIGLVGVLLATDEARSARWRLHIDDDHAAVLHLPDGGTVDLDVPDVDPQLVSDELSRLDLGALIDLGEDPAEHSAVVDVSGNGHPTSHTDSAEPAWCEVRLLGPVQVVRDGTPVDSLTPRSLEVLAYLVTHRDGVTKERLDDAVWAGHASRAGSQRVTAALTKLRASLGDGPDGHPLVPRRAAGEPVQLSESVGCDLDRAFAHLALARDLPGELRSAEQTAALDLVRGEPFQDLPVSWASDITQRAIIQLQEAALDLAQTHREAGNFDAAEAAIEQGMQVFDPADALYLERAEIAKARGFPEHVPMIWRELRRKHAEDADEIAGTVSTPPVDIELAFQALMSAV